MQPVAETLPGPAELIEAAGSDQGVEALLRGRPAEERFVLLGSACLASSSTSPQNSDALGLLFPSLARIDKTVVLRLSDLAMVSRILFGVADALGSATQQQTQWLFAWAVAATEERHGELLRKLSMRGHCRIVAEAFMSQLGRDNDPDLFKLASAGQRGDGLLLAGLSLSNFCSRFARPDEQVAGRVLLFRRVLSPAEMFALLDSLPKVDDLAERLAQVWASKDFVVRSERRRHALVTGALRYCMRKGCLSEAILGGVQAHLGCNVPEKRHLGMRLGEEYARLAAERGLLTSQERLDFEIPPFSDEYGAPDHVPNSEPSKDQETNPAKFNEILTKMLDPDVPVTWPWPPADPFEALVEADNEYDDDECSLSPLDLTDDAPIGASVPKHIVQCEEALASQTDVAKVQAALDALAGIISRRKSEAMLRGRSLCNALLLAENRFNLPDFCDKIRGALVALVVAAPQECGPALADAVYSNRMPLGPKAEALDVIVDACTLISRGTPPLSFAVASRELLNRNETNERDPNKLGKDIRKSRALLKGRQNLNTSSANELAPIVLPSFFNPLLRRPGRLAEEPILLAKFITTLASLLSLARHAAPGHVLRMASAIRDLVPFAMAKPEAETRRACLYALTAVAVAMGGQLTEEEIGFAQHAAREDPDEVCRALARDLSG